MADEATPAEQDAPLTPTEPADPASAPGGSAGGPGTAGSERPDIGLSERVRRVVSAGFEVASRSKEDIVRVATGEIRSWLDRLDLSNEIRNALTKMVIEVKTEVRFRASDDGKIVSESSSDVKVNNPAPPKG